MSNPRKALTALNVAPVPVGDYIVYPVTLAMCGVLEAIGSPLVTQGGDKSLGAMAETLFAMTRPVSESRGLLAGLDGRERYRVAAEAWADTVPFGIGARLLNEAYAQVNAAMGIMPDGDGEGNP